MVEARHVLELHVGEKPVVEDRPRKGRVDVAGCDLDKRGKVEGHLLEFEPELGVPGYATVHKG